jgi:hypothetical protein
MKLHDSNKILRLHSDILKKPSSQRVCDAAKLKIIIFIAVNMYQREKIKYTRINAVGHALDGSHSLRHELFKQSSEF